MPHPTPTSRALRPQKSKHTYHAGGGQPAGGPGPGRPLRRDRPARPLAARPRRAAGGGVGRVGRRACSAAAACVMLVFRECLLTRPTSPRLLAGMRRRPFYSTSRFQRKFTE
jgi:hypothetical protein